MGDKFYKLLYCFMLIVVVLSVILLAGVIILYIIAVVKYANTPLGELPTWMFILFGGK